MCGYSVGFSSDGQRLVYGCPGATVGLFLFAGKVKIVVFDSISRTWSKYTDIIEGEGVGYDTGRSVSISGNGHRIAYTGAVPTQLGNVYPGFFVLELDSDLTKWVPYGSFVQVGNFDDQLAVAANHDGNLVAVGNVGALQRGYATVYEAIYKGNDYPYYIVDSEYHN